MGVWPPLGSSGFAQSSAVTALLPSVVCVERRVWGLTSHANGEDGFLTPRSQVATAERRQHSTARVSPSEELSGGLARNAFHVGVSASSCTAFWRNRTAPVRASTNSL